MAREMQKLQNAPSCNGPVGPRTRILAVVLSCISAACGGGGGASSPALAPAGTAPIFYPPVTTLSRPDSDGEPYRAEATTGTLHPFPSATSGSLFWDAGRLTCSDDRGVRLLDGTAFHRIVFRPRRGAPGFTGANGGPICSRQDSKRRLGSLHLAGRPDECRLFLCDAWCMDVRHFARKQRATVHTSTSAPRPLAVTYQCRVRPVFRRHARHLRRWRGYL
jgi:hypothetical protein